jgi:hypothetical protein
MLKKVTLIFAVVIMTATLSLAQWKYEGPWPNANFKGGSHGMEIDPDGKIWQASYYKSNFIKAKGDTIKNVSPIFVFYPDGSKVDTIGIVNTNGILDTLGKGGGTSGTRGLCKDEQGNIIFISGSPSKMIKIDYKSYKGIARFVFTSEIGSSPAGPAVSSDGTVFVGPVVGNKSQNSKIAMFDKNFSYLGTAVTGPPAIVRTFEVSKDGNTIYWTTFTGNQGIYVYNRPDEFSAYTLKDSLLQGMSIESAAWNPVTNLLWVSNDSRGLNKKYSDKTWYGVNLSTKQIVDSLKLPKITPAYSDSLPRAIAFSADGKTAYVGLFGAAFDRIYKFTNTGSAIEKLDEMPVGYELSQNYPNPFNPTTNIKFSLPKEGFVTLRVYNSIGQEVATLVNDFKSAGSYQVDFNASNLSSGVYVYTLSVGNYKISKKMMLMK